MLSKGKLVSQSGRGFARRLPAVIRLLGLTALTLATQAAGAEDLTDRLKREAVGLFKSVIGPSSDADRCKMSKEWLKHAVPRETAQRYLGLTLHADLVPAAHHTEFSEIIDASWQVEGKLCDYKEFVKYRDNLFSEIRENIRTDKEKTTFKGVTITIINFTFPVFDQDFTSAVIVKSHTSWRLDSRVRGPALWIYGEAQFYRKEGDAWRLAADEPLFHAH